MDAAIEKLRRMINEPSTENYTDTTLETILADHPVNDAEGLTPETEGWTPSYDLNAAASEIWTEKAATVAAEFDFTADGGSYQRSQKYQSYLKLAASYASKRKAKIRPLTVAASEGDQE